MPDPKSDLEHALNGKTVVAARRKGKHLWLDLGPANKAVLFHFGDRPLPAHTHACTMPAATASLASRGQGV